MKTRTSPSGPEASASGITTVSVPAFPPGFPPALVTMPAPGMKNGDAVVVTFAEPVSPLSILILPHLVAEDEQVVIPLSDVNETSSGWPGGDMSFAWSAFRTS